jgi:hypothetical protein
MDVWGMRTFIKSERTPGSCILDWLCRLNRDAWLNDEI